MPFIITDSNGKYIHITPDNAKTEITSDITKATRFEYAKANNFLNYNLTRSKNEWKVVCIDEIDNLNMDEIIQIQTDIYKKVQGYTEYLLGEQKINEREITDIYHYIEFSNLNAAKGFKAYKMLQDRLIKRRAIKDDLEKASIVLGASAEDYMNRKVINQFDSLKERQYSPRVLKELFE